MLKESKLPPADEVVFSNKASLYKTADTGININNYEEYFLLHTDKELSANEEGEVEQFVLQHPQLQEEFLLLQQTKLIPEKIEYPDKKHLYRQPDKRVVPLYIARIAVAAVITGVLVLIGSFWMNNSQPQVAIHVQCSQPDPLKKVNYQAMKQQLLYLERKAMTSYLQKRKHSV